MSSGTVTTLAGTGESGYSGGGGPATEATLAGPLGLTTTPWPDEKIAERLKELETPEDR